MGFLDSQILVAQIIPKIPPSVIIINPSFTVLEQGCNKIGISAIAKPIANGKMATLSQSTMFTSNVRNRYNILLPQQINWFNSIT
ncbi:MAG: hypothetical protein V9F05_02620 [Chitinophagaceae bacterium]